MKNIKCKYVKYCELSKDCNACDLSSHKQVNSNIIKQLKMEAINKKRREIEIKSVK